MHMTDHADQADQHEHAAQIDERPPPKWPKVIGILSTVLGILAITCGIGGVAMMIASDQLFGGMMGGSLPDGTPPPPMSPPIGPLIIASTALNLIVNILLVAAGIMLIRRKPTARSLHLVYAVIAIVAAFFGSYAGYQAAMQQQQEMKVWLEQHGDTDLGKQIAAQQSQQAGMQQTIRIVSTAIGLGLALAWPMFCIVWFGMVKRDPDDMLGPDGIARDGF